MTEVTKTKSEFLLGVLMGTFVTLALCTCLFCCYGLFAVVRFDKIVHAWEVKAISYEGKLLGEERVNSHLLNENDRIVKRWANAPAEAK